MVVEAQLYIFSLNLTYPLGDQKRRALACFRSPIFFITSGNLSLGLLGPFSYMLAATN